MSRHVNFLVLTFSCLYNEVLHEGKSPRHLYIFLEAWLEMNKLIFAWQVAELKYVFNFCQKNAQSPWEIQEVKKKKKAYYTFHACLSGCLGLYKNSQKVYSRLFAKVLESCSGCTAFGFRVSGLKAISRWRLAWQTCSSLCICWF